MRHLVTRREFAVSSFAACAAGAVALGVSRSARSQTARNIARILIGVPAGGAADAVARLLADQMKSYASATIVEIRSGAGYRLALEAAKNSPADGSIMILAPAGPLTLYPHIYKSLNYNPQQDFAPVSTVFSTPSMLAIGPMVPGEVKTLADLIAWCRGNPKQSTFGTPGAGSPMHLLGITLARTARIELVHVPYQGAPPAVQNLLGGQIAVAISPIGNFVPYLKTGNLRALATTGPQRSSVLPDVPTVAEAGYPALEFAEWFGILLPAKTPSDTVNSLNAVIREALRTKDVMAGLANFSMDIGGNSPAEFARQIKIDTERWAAIVKASGFTPLD
jgi:tripartite-type tricarboxylate transporter receptor subunit TctC